MPTSACHTDADVVRHTGVFQEAVAELFDWSRRAPGSVALCYEGADCGGDRRGERRGHRFCEREAHACRRRPGGDHVDHAFWASSSAVPMSPTTRVSPAMNRADSILQIVSVARW